MTLKLGKAQQQSNATQVPEIRPGQYPARLVHVVDLGVQPQTDWQTHEPKDPKAKVLFTFELPSQRIETDEGDKPRFLSKEYTFSNFEQAALPGVVANLDPFFDIEEGDLSELLGSECMVAIGKTSKDKPKITGVNPPIEGMEVPELENDKVSFDFSEPSLDDLKALPKWVQRKIMEAVNYPDSELAVLIDADEYVVE